MTPNTCTCTDEKHLSVACVITGEIYPVHACWALGGLPFDLRWPLAGAWGMECDELDPFLLGNQVMLRPDLKNTYERGLWALVPCLATLKEIAAKARVLGHSSEPRPSYLEAFPHERRDYHIVHFRGSPDEFIRAIDSYSPSEVPFVVDKKPFQYSPTVKSSAHPYFIVVSVALSVLDRRRAKVQVKEQPSAIQECLDLCVVIYKQWLDFRRLRSDGGSSSAALAQQGQAKRGKRALSELDGEVENQTIRSGSSKVSRSRVKRG